MGCLLVLLALAFPRIVILLLAVCSNFLGNAYDSALWPVLGFFFMPFTTLAYALAINQAGSVDGLYLVLVVIAVLVDIGAIGGGGHHARRRRK